MAWFGFDDSDRPEDIRHNFSYKLDTVNYKPNKGLLGAIGNLEGISDKQMGMGDEFSESYRNMLDPNSAYYQRLFGNLRRDVGDTYANMNTNMNQALAQRGVGKGGMSNLLSAVNSNQAGEQIRKGMTNIQDVGLQRAGQFGQLATGAYGSAGNISGRVGDLRSGIDARGLQTDMTNAATKNAYRQYLNTSRYNLMMANQRRQDAYDNQQANQRGAFFRTAGTLVGGLLGGPGGAMGVNALMGGLSPSSAPMPNQPSGSMAMNTFQDTSIPGTSGYSNFSLGQDMPTLTYSDIRLKDNVKKVGKEKGINLYEFNYKWDKDKKYIGVMAQDIVDTNPDSVKVVDGYYVVDYDVLGIQFKEVN